MALNPAVLLTETLPTRATLISNVGFIVMTLTRNSRKWKSQMGMFPHDHTEACALTCRNPCRSIILPSWTDLLFITKHSKGTRSEECCEEATLWGLLFSLERNNPYLSRSEGLASQVQGAFQKGSERIMSTCSSTVYPPAVIESVMKQMREVTPTAVIPNSLELQPSLRNANLRDVVVGLF